LKKKRKLLQFECKKNITHSKCLLVEIIFPSDSSIVRSPCACQVFSPDNHSFVRWKTHDKRKI